MRFYVRDVEREKTFEIEGKKEVMVEEIIDQLDENYHPKISDLKLYSKGDELDARSKLMDNDVKENDILILSKNKLKFAEKADTDIVELAKDWLKENIGVSKNQIKLKYFESEGKDKKNIIFEDESSQYRLTTTSDRVKDYRFLSLEEKDVENN